MASDDAAQRSPEDPEKRGYQVADLIIDVARQRITRAETEIRLSPRTFAFLLALVRAAPDVLSSEQLMDRVWPGRVVGPGTVSQRAKILRRALGDSARAPRYVAGVRGRGYRMAAPVVLRKPIKQPAAADGAGVVDAGVHGPPATPAARAARLAAGAPTRSIWIVGTAFVLLVAAVAWWDGSPRNTQVAEPAPAATVRASVAVLPFANMSPERDDEHLSDGLAEELMNLLARSPELRVIARTSSFSFKDKNVDIATIARRLNVTHVLEGSVRKWRDRIRISVQLIDTSTSSRVWSETYERSLDDILAVQQDVAASAARALEVTLDLEQPARAAPADPRAYESYLTARFFYYRRADGDLERAKQYYLQALDLAPEDARAWAGLAAVYGLEFGRGGSGRAAALAKQREAAERALALDPQLSEAHSRMAHYFQNAGDMQAAAREHREALAFDPWDPVALTDAAASALTQGNLERAIELQERVVSVDPAAFMHKAQLGNYLAAAGRLEEAREALLQALELNPAPTAADTIDGVLPAAVLAQVLILLGQLDEASAVVAQLPFGPDRDQCMTLIEHARGRYAAAEATLERLAANHDAIDAIRLAEVYAYWGEHERAFEWLEAGRERIRDALRLSPAYPEGRWWIYQTSLKISPLLRPLHADPRWNRLIEAGVSSSTARRKDQRTRSVP